MKRGKLGFLLIILVLAVSLVSAGIGDWFKQITGKAPSGEQNVSVSVTGANVPKVSYVQDINSIDPTEYGITTVVFETHVYDADGAGNIEHSSVSAKFTKAAVTRNGVCSHPNNIDSYTANYSCSVIINYYDSAGNWVVNVSARDQENNYAENTSEIFMYNELKSFTTPLSPTNLNWPPLIPGASNIESNNDPTLVNNTGNYAGNIYLTAYNLVGETNGAENIPSTAFSVSGTSGLECSGTTLLSDGSDTDTNIGANPGSPGSNLANIYYCLDVPVVSSQIYSTTARGESWIVKYI